MREFRTSKVFAGLLAIGVIAVGTDVLGQGRGKGGHGKHGGQVERGNQGGGHPGRGRSIQQQMPQQQAVQPNRGHDRRAEIQQRMQQVQQQRQQQAQQWGQQNRGIDRRAQMQQMQQQRQQQNRGGDRRAQMQQRMLQIQHQRQQQAQQWGLQNRGIDRRAQIQQRMHQIQQRQQQAQQIQQQRMQAAQAQQNRGYDRRAQMQQRMQQIQLQRQQQAPQWVQQNRGSDRRAQMQRRLEQVQQQRQQYGAQRGWRGPGNERRSSFRDGQNMQPQIVPQPKAKDWFTQMANRRDWSEDRFRDGRRARNSFSGQQSLAFNDSWPKNYGQMRRAEVHARNAERRAWRNRDSWSSGASVYWQPQTYARTYRPRTFYDSYVYGSTYQEPYSYSGRYSADRNYPYYADRSNSYSNVYEEPYYDYAEYDRPSAADIFRNVIFAVLGGGNPGYEYDPYYGSSYGRGNLAYAPSYVSYNSGDSYPAGYSYATDPSYYDPYFYQDPYYAEVLPIQYFVADQPGGGLFRQMFTHLLAVGYDQGYQDGLAARRIRERDRVFYDPYAYDNAAYDPYSVSLGDNRRCLSQGYELGYEDAVDGIDEYDEFQNGEVDLVSVLIGTVSQLI